MSSAAERPAASCDICGAATHLRGCPASYSAGCPECGSHEEKSCWPPRHVHVGACSKRADDEAFRANWRGLAW